MTSIGKLVSIGGKGALSAPPDSDLQVGEIHASGHSGYAVNIRSPGQDVVHEIEVLRVFELPETISNAEIAELIVRLHKTAAEHRSAALESDSVWDRVRSHLVDYSTLAVNILDLSEKIGPWVASWVAASGVRT